MIGDIPQDAPRKCRKGEHIGQEKGGTMVFYCPRCGGSFWQPYELRSLNPIADRMIDEGRGDEAIEMVRDRVRRFHGGRQSA